MLNKRNEHIAAIISVRIDDDMNPVLNEMQETKERVEIALTENEANKYFNMTVEKRNAYIKSRINLLLSL